MSFVEKVGLFQYLFKIQLDISNFIFSFVISILINNFLIKQKMEKIKVDSRFDNPANSSVHFTSILKETDKAIEVSVKRVLPAQRGNDGFYCSVYEDTMWIPKSQINEFTISKWFCEKESIISAI